MALNFNGSNQYVAFNDSTVFNASAITIMAWASPTSIPSGLSVICSTNSVASGYRAPYALFFNAGRLTAQITYSYTSGFIFQTTYFDTITVTSPNAIAVNKWVHVAFTYEAGMLRIYENGRLVASAATNRTPIMGNTATVGADRTGANSLQAFYSGVLEDFRIYNRTLTANEILTISTLRGKDTILNGGVTQLGLNDMPNNASHPSNLPVFNLFKSSIVGLAVNGPSYRDSFANILKRW